MLIFLWLIEFNKASDLHFYMFNLLKIDSRKPESISISFSEDLIDIIFCLEDKDSNISTNKIPNPEVINLLLIYKSV